MAASSGPDIIDTGLVLALDAADMNSYDSNENLMTNSQLGTAILNDGGAVTLTTDTSIINPFGGYDGVLKCVHTTNTPGYFRRGQLMSLTAGVTYTFSVFFKNGNVTSPYNVGDTNAGPSLMYVAGVGSGTGPTFDTNAQSLNTTISFPNGWYRQVYTFTPSYTQAYHVVFNQAVNQTPIGTYYLYGFQLEKSSSASTYYPTTASAKNRGTTWTNLISSGIGTLTNGPTYNSSNNGSIVFDGVDDFINSGALPGSFASFSVIIWFYPTSVTNYENPIDCNFGYYGSTGNIGPRLEMDNNGVLGWVYSNDTAVNNNFYSHIVVSNGLAANTWHCAAITYDGTTNFSTTYYNGNPTGISRVSIGSPTGFVGTMNNVNIGRGFSSGLPERIFTGRVGNVEIYNRVLTSSEIQQNFNALRSRFRV